MRRPRLLIYPLLFFLVIGPACSLTSHLALRAATVKQPTPTSVRRIIHFPVISSKPIDTPVVLSVNSVEVLIPTPAPEPVPEDITEGGGLSAETAPPSAENPEASQPGSILVQPSTVAKETNDISAAITVDILPSPLEALPTDALELISPPVEVTDTAPVVKRTRRPTLTATPAINSLAGLLNTLSQDTPTPSRTPLPTFTPTPTNTYTPTPTPTPTDTATPTITPTPTDTATPTNTPLPTDTPAPTNTPTATPIPPPTATPLPTNTPLPEYDFMVAEFFNSPTTNSFLVMYVAIVDANETPIGGMKIVGTRLDHNLTYESPLSTWYFEGYNAPGQVIKTGNVKFEPPGGIETTSWIFHLEDAQDTRYSADIPFDTDENSKQWYLVRLKRKY